MRDGAGGHWPIGQRSAAGAPGNGVARDVTRTRGLLPGLSAAATLENVNALTRVLARWRSRRNAPKPDRREEAERLAEAAESQRDVAKATAAGDHQIRSTGLFG